MIQLKEVEKEIADMMEEWEGFKKMHKAERDLTINKKRIKELRTRIPILRQARKYLETNPSAETVKESYNKTQARIENIVNGFVPNNLKTLTEQNKDRKVYEKEYRIPHLRSQAKTLKYLLKS